MGREQKLLKKIRKEKLKSLFEKLENYKKSKNT